MIFIIVLVGLTGVGFTEDSNGSQAVLPRNGIDGEGKWSMQASVRSRNGNLQDAHSIKNS